MGDSEIYQRIRAEEIKRNAEGPKPECPVCGALVGGPHFVDCLVGDGARGKLIVTGKESVYDLAW